MTVDEAIKNVTAYVYMEAENIPEMVAKALNVLKDKARKAEQYEVIGLVEELRELKEKAMAERRCPNCNELLNSEHRFCPTCRRKTDWSEGKER